MRSEIRGTFNKYVECALALQPFVTRRSKWQLLPLPIFLSYPPLDDCRKDWAQVFLCKAHLRLRQKTQRRQKDEGENAIQFVQGES